MSDQNPTPATLRVYTTDEDDTTVALIARRHRHYQRRFKTMFENAMIKLAGLDRPPCYFRALCFALAELDPVQWRALSAKEIAKGASMSMASAERGLSMLEADRVILAKGATANKRRRLNNQVVWASNSEKWNAAEPDPEVSDTRGRA